MRSGELIGSDLGARDPLPGDLDTAWATLDRVMDPEVPVVSVLDPVSYTHLTLPTKA